MKQRGVKAIDYFVLVMAVSTLMVLVLGLVVKVDFFVNLNYDLVISSLIILYCALTGLKFMLTARERLGTYMVFFSVICGFMLMVYLRASGL